MIRINKPVIPPDILSTRGQIATDELCRRFENGEREFEFDSNIYGTREVKEALIEAQHDKCCFCESKITATQDGDVEHFRPKKGYKQKKQQRLQKPGYYWLAYRWDNLFLSCITCNQRKKQNYFPLFDPSKRALSHKDNVSQDDPIFIDFTKENPEDFISFKDEIALGIDDQERGSGFISVLDLNRTKLLAQRFELLHSVKDQIDIITVADVYSRERRQQAQDWLNYLTTDSGEFAGMTRAYLKSINFTNY